MVLLNLVSVAWSQAPTPRPGDAERKSVTDKAIGYLRTQQGEDGSFSKKLGGPGVTALVLAAALRNGVSADDPLVVKALKYLENSTQKDGGIYEKILPNYTTSVAVLALREANQEGKYAGLIERAAKFLKGLQYDEEHSIDASRPEYGGAGYDGKSRPDLSNTQFFIEALAAAGVGKDDPAMKRAIVFLGNSQNVPGEHNKQDWAKKVSEEDRGGFVYSPVPGSRKNQTPEGGLRSEGAMTYAGLKSFLHAGVEKNDPRVQAAIGWIRRNYTVDEHPGQGKAGLFYYYHTFAKAMDAMKEGDTFRDAKGKEHPWRRELFDVLKAKQSADGSWSNPDDKFFEGDGNLCTAFSLLAISYCK
jgi:squalene-hopene/tetraprenyl-beta-curcumene cyclase